MKEVSELSFVFYESFMTDLDDVSAEERTEFITAIINYGLYGTEPEFKGFMKKAFYQAAESIDRAKNKREQDIEKGKKGGAPKGNQNARKEENNPKQPETTQNNLNVNVNDNVNENGDVNVGVSAPSLSEPQKDYSKQVYDILLQNGFPCCNNDYMTFVQRDFRQSLQYLRGYTSDEVIQSLKNYIAEVKDPESYPDKKLGFYGFAKSSYLYSCTPGNYSHDNFRKYISGRSKEQPKETEQTRTDPMEKFNAPKKCPCCGKPTTWFPGVGDPAVKCTNEECRNFAESHDKGISWEWAETEKKAG